MDRLQEPSSWAGIAGILSTIAGFLPGLPGLIVGGCAAATGGVAVFLRERHA